jgi:hypothetical protein
MARVAADEEVQRVLSWLIVGLGLSRCNYGTDFEASVLVRLLSRLVPVHFAVPTLPGLDVGLRWVIHQSLKGCAVVGMNMITSHGCCDLVSEANNKRCQMHRSGRREKMIRWAKSICQFGCHLSTPIQV